MLRIECAGHGKARGSVRLIGQTCHVPTINRRQGAIAQLGERLLCKQEVVGSIPSGSTILWFGLAIPRISRELSCRNDGFDWHFDVL